MTRLLLSAALLLAASAPSRAAFFGRKQEEVLHKVALLWVPAETFSDWASVSEAFRRNEDLRLTAGLTPEMATPAFLAEMRPWLDLGRFDAALRLAGDPILPLIAAPRPEDPLQRLALARSEFSERLGRAPSGFVPGGGALTARLLADIQSMGFSWAAVGDYGEEWVKSAGVILAPLRTLRTSALPESPAPAAFLLDEADGFVTPGSLLTLLSGLKPKQPWSTLSESAASLDAQSGVSTATSPSSDTGGDVPIHDRTLPWSLEGAAPPNTEEGGRGRGTWPTWLGGTEAWTDAPEQKKAWKLYADAAKILERYQNSGGADLEVLENAVKKLHLAQAGRYFRVLSDPEKSDAEFRRHLSELYRLLRQPVPADVSASALSSSQPAAASARFKSGETWLEFENTPNRVLGAGDLWTILGLRVDWDDKDLTLTYKLKRLEPDVSAARGFGRLLLDAYIDLNHVVGAGSTKLMDGRGSFTLARDAWEYALTVTGWGCSVYRFNPRGSPVKAFDCSWTADLKGGFAQAKIPRSVLRGNPARWGYVAVALETDRAAASLSPPKPSRPGILGYLEQDAVAGKPGLPDRLSAARAP